jgi:hypothetical protein
MRLGLRAATYILVLAGIGSIGRGQSSAPAHKPAVPSKKYCHLSAGFCFRYPASWTVLGNVFNGNGVVIAPAQKGDREQWDAITVALVATADENGEGPSLNKIIEQTTDDMRSAGQDFQTLQRKELTVDHNPAQMLKTHYRENSSGKEWIEELVFLQGQENDIYSVSLKCAPQNLVRLEPALKELLASWTVPEPTASPGTVPNEASPHDAPTPSDSAQPQSKP